MFDIGGGSSELMLVSPDSFHSGRPEPEIIDWVSLPWGVVSLAETEPQWQGAPDRALAFERMLAKVAPQLDAFVARLAARGVKEVQLLGTSGTITTLASVELGLPGYDRRRVDGCSVDGDSMLALCRRIALQSVAGTRPHRLHRAGTRRTDRRRLRHPRLHFAALAGRHGAGGRPRHPRRHLADPDEA